MGKGFQNFMSKKDFHPSAWWNLKRVWEAREVKSKKDQREEEMRVAYQKEQEVLNNKALLGDEKAKLGLSFMYEAPAGISKKEEPKEEPKFEWQRKYQAPREEWAKGNELIQDQPFGIQVRNVRCVKCHKWGHLNTDSECPLFGMSGNYEDSGYANNPSDLIKTARKEKLVAERSAQREKDQNQLNEEQPDRVQLAEDMREEHGFRLKGNVLDALRMDDQLARLGASSSSSKPKTEAEQMNEFIKGLSKKEMKKLMRKIRGEEEETKSKKKDKKDKKKSRKEKRARVRSPSHSRTPKRDRQEDRSSSSKHSNDRNERSRRDR
ncbi:unnamed protein product, partial [Mesorhabditis belari]|uniref:CBF1-interacting co-repressor CIR N-terminal domain-containing protein n=1 Tax=Mesorhabditis belari TaxID=2138241 RepID=A0AAF3F446_9BILA